MPRYLLRKLVRDNIPKLNKKLGIGVKARKLAKDELASSLIEKFVEEAAELQNSSNNKQRIKELADLQQIIDDLIVVLGLSEDDVLNKQSDISMKAGRFLDGQYVEYLDVPAGTKWDQYYAKEPDRFPSEPLPHEKTD